MTDENPDFTMTPCASCNQTSTEDETMAECDGCRRWFHTRCVNFNPVDRKPGKKWYCPDKECQKKKRSKKSVDEPLPLPLAVQEKLKAMEEERKHAEAEQEAARVIRQKELEMNAYLQERQLKIDQELREQAAQRAEELREEELKQLKVALETEMKKKEEHLKRVQELEKSFRDRGASIDKLLKNSSTPLRNPDVKLLTEENVGKHDKGKNSEGEPIPRRTPGNSTESETDSQLESSEDSGDGGESGEESKEDGKRAKSKGSDKTAKAKPDGLGQLKSGPTKAQRAARQGLTRKLPDFHGKPEEWPLFFAAYQASNEACGYTDVENLLRLQDCLKGRALEEVRGQLILPKSVPRVIAKLRQLYGRPELLLQNHLQRVRKLEAPKADKLATYIPFGNAVEQLCEHIEAAELTPHLVNPILIQELVDKLPDGEKRSWVHYKRKRKEVTLRTFTNFLSRIVEDACEANINLDYKWDSKAVSGSSGKGRQTAAMFCHSDAESQTEWKEQQPKQLKQCKMCQRTDHRLRFCDDFKKLPFEERMSIVTKWRLCHRCLNGHGGNCHFDFRCNVGECREPHNPLLHPSSAVGMSAHITTSSPVLFRMLPVKVYCGERSRVVLAFLDEGSSLTLVESELADSLGLNGTAESLEIKWTANITRVEHNSRRMNLWASATNGSCGEKLLLQSVRTVDKLMLPHQKLNAEEVATCYDHLQGLPVESYDSRPRMLIGLNNIHSFAPLEVKVGTTLEPVAVRCKLGWAVYGPRDMESACTSSFLGCHQGVAIAKLHALPKNDLSPHETVGNEEPRARQKQGEKEFEKPAQTNWSGKTQVEDCTNEDTMEQINSTTNDNRPSQRKTVEIRARKRRMPRRQDCEKRNNPKRPYENSKDEMIGAGHVSAWAKPVRMTSAAVSVIKKSHRKRERSIPGTVNLDGAGERKTRVCQTNSTSKDGNVIGRTEVLAVKDGKSDVPTAGPTDVTGWGVTTAQMGALVDGAIGGVTGNPTTTVNARE